MRPCSYSTAWLAVGLLLPLGGPAVAQMKAELVSTAKVWEQGAKNVSPDVVRFKDGWVMACLEGGGTVRVLTSADGDKWEAAARIKSATPDRGLYRPKLSVAADGRLLLTAYGVVPNFHSPQPVPMYGGMLRTMGWYSKDGKEWGERELDGEDNYPFGRVAWHKGEAYTFGCGTICGSMQTVQVLKSKGGKPFDAVYKETFSGFFPGEGALLFDGDTAYCLMSRQGTTDYNPPITGSFGTAKAPFTDWEWKDVDAKLTAPTLLRLADKRVVAAVGLTGEKGKARTALCELDPATGKLTEVLDLPTGGKAVGVGLVEHDGHVWVSYHATADKKESAHLAKVKVK